jgi:hypothetical protein
LNCEWQINIWVDILQVRQVWMSLNRLNIVCPKQESCLY